MQPQPPPAAPVPEPEWVLWGAPTLSSSPPMDNWDRGCRRPLPVPVGPPVPPTPCPTSVLSPSREGPSPYKRAGPLPSLRGGLSSCNTHSILPSSCVLSQVFAEPPAGSVWTLDRGRWADAALPALLTMGLTHWEPVVWGTHTHLSLGLAFSMPVHTQHGPPSTADDSILGSTWDTLK